MFETQEVELNDGSKMILLEEEVNYMAAELVNFLPESILRQWIKQTEWIGDEFKLTLLELEEQSVREKVAYMVAFFVAHRRHRFKQTKEEI